MEPTGVRPTGPGAPAGASSGDEEARGPNDHHSGPPSTRDLPGGPHRDAEAGAEGRDPDDVADRPLAGGEVAGGAAAQDAPADAGDGPGRAPDADLRRPPDHHRRGAPGTGYPDGGGPSAPASEHADWGDTAYGVSVE